MSTKKVQLRKILSTDLLPVVYNYLVSIGLESVAEKLSKKSGLDLENSESPLSEKKLQKIVKFYVTNHKQMIQQFIVKPEPVESEESDEEEEEVKAKKSKKSSKKAALNGKRKAQSDDEEEEEEVQETKSSKKQLKKEKEEKVEEEEKTEEQAQPVSLMSEQPLRGERKYFQKCDDSRIQFIKSELKDNTHDAKKRFGHGDTFGDEGNEKLKVVQGKDFRKQKDKLKNKGFCHGDSSINTSQVNSIPL